MKAKYIFTEDINKEIERLQKYLKELRYHQNTIGQYKNSAGIYLEWLKENGYRAEEMNYKDIITFIDDLRKEKSDNQIRRIIAAAKHYHSSIESEINPVRGIYLKGVRKAVINHIISYDEIVACYEEYDTYSEKQKRNKLILSLMLHQGLATADISNLEVRHIKLQEGKIYIPKTEITNSRILNLEARQMLEIQEYLLVIRPQIIEKINEYLSGAKVKNQDDNVLDKLFIGDNGATLMKLVVANVFKQVKKKYPRITSGKVIRATVIAEWLKTIDIRKVQYMAGHRYVSTTETYNVMNLAELKDSLNKYHPLK